MKPINSLIKNVYIAIIAILFFSCSSDSPTEPPKEEEPIIEKPIAVDDAVTGIEDETLVISTLLTNDTTPTNSRITSFDATSTKGGTITDDRNGSYSYEPTKGFVGSDTFTYTLCDRETTPNCSTATVTITIEDEGTPTAENDSYFTVENTNVTITSALDNDTLTDDAVLFSVDGTTASGSVLINGNGDIVYTPQANFIGDDTFTYTICDDDTPTANCATATISISILEKINFNIPVELASYYEGVAFSDNAGILLNSLTNHTTSKHTTLLSYGQRHNYLYSADEDVTIADNVILMYSGESRDYREYTSGTNTHSPQTFNTEHIFPQSRLSSTEAVADLHHLRSCDAGVNSERSNYPYTDGTGTYQLIDGNKWYPGDEWRGDVARMVLYLNVRHNEDYTKVGTLALFLEWNRLDPVSTFEEQRNNIIAAAQGNRNPFIDNPYLATLIWGGVAAQNKWE